ncbi:MAG: hypothetical protein APG12_00429 [Candidatus Methanofastidiosum methylothiophilum]|uniref:Uncharacterized protein n=1 Tax=Candidatus Methanofastidiosum methylothiophilum TaxID=1705564 RepID=A0A150IHT8_9EURY|nr:MAG: hypothetical protein APG10_01751 [Candidatus Methanofastidiosum methylthiophilus]KYC46529.1 MAG: hypothetical protein APG11_01835 [Candidatus Methanofastidiosum methylthiophilus]KYC51005.1 MAG: hypothetical protein APG12_00429 [Candidatus Methanofastidiosum methylthiophilus]
MGASLNIDSKDFTFQGLDTRRGCIDDASAKDDSLYDAYDGAFYLFINKIDFTDYNYRYHSSTGAYTTEAGGREYVFDKVTLSGLTVSRKFYFPEDRNWVRCLEILYNPTGSPITVDVIIKSNLGSDSSTRVVMTSSGDKIVDKNDYWSVSDDQYGGHQKYDPSLAFNWDGPNGAKRVDSVEELMDTKDNLTYRWDKVTVNPGQTVVLMHFGGLGKNNNEVIAIAQDLYNYNDSKMEYDLQEKDLIINWYPQRKKSLPMAKILDILKANKDKE